MRGRPTLDAVIAAIAQARAADQSYAEIAAALGRTKESVRKLVRRHVPHLSGRRSRRGRGASHPEAPVIQVDDVTAVLAWAPRATPSIMSDAYKPRRRAA